MTDATADDAPVDDAFETAQGAESLEAEQPEETSDDAAAQERGPRLPFAGVPVRDLVADGVAAAALLVSLALPWRFPEPGVTLESLLGAAGTSRLEVLLTVALALFAVVAPYARRAGILTAAWAADEKRVRLIGVVPLLVVALVHVVIDAVPGGAWGVGAGLGLGLAGALLAARHTRLVDTPSAVWAVGGLVGVLAVLSPVLFAVGDESPSAWWIVGAVVTALLALGFLWLTVWRFQHGDHAAGVLLVAVGIVVALGIALFAADAGAPWTESAQHLWLGVLLWPALAAVAAPRVIGQATDAGAQPRLWADTALYALELAIGLGLYLALLNLVAILDGTSGTPVVLRIVFGVAIAAVAFYGWRALRQNLALGHSAAVGAAVVIAALGLVLVVVRAAGDARGVDPVDALVTFGVPAIILAVLLVPRSLRGLRAEIAAAEPVVADDVAPFGVGADPFADAPTPRPVRTAGHRSQAAAAAAAAAPAGPTVESAVEQTQVFQAGTIAAPGVADAARGAETVEVSPDEVAAKAAAEQASAQAAAQAAAAQAAAAAAQAAGPFGTVGATQIIPAIADDPESRWSAAQAADPATPLADLALIVQEAPHLRPLVASNPSTYPALLDWLGALGDPAIDAALRARG